MDWFLYGRDLRNKIVKRERSHYFLKHLYCQKKFKKMFRLFGLKNVTYEMKKMAVLFIFLFIPSYMQMNPGGQ